MGVPLKWRRLEAVGSTAELWQLYWGDWFLGQVEEGDNGGSIIQAMKGKVRRTNAGRDEAMQLVCTLVACHLVEATSCCLNHSDRIEKEGV